MQNRNLLSRQNDAAALEDRVMLAAISSDLFDDGESGTELTSSGSRDFVFDGLDHEHYTSGGNGPRDEFKIENSFRVPTSETEEQFSATVSSDISDGGRAIIAQYKAGSGSRFLLYLSDGQSRNGGEYDVLEDDVPGNGVFDIYSTSKDSSGDLVYNSYGTVEAGESFDILLEKSGTTLDVLINGETNAESIDLGDSSESYFKFGSYVQSEDPDERDDLTESGDTGAGDALRDIGITRGEVTFTDTDFTTEPS